MRNDIEDLTPSVVKFGGGGGLFLLQGLISFCLGSASFFTKVLMYELSMSLIMIVAVKAASI